MHIEVHGKGERKRDRKRKNGEKQQIAQYRSAQIPLDELPLITSLTTRRSKRRNVCIYLHSCYKHQNENKGGGKRERERRKMKMKKRKSV